MIDISFQLHGVFYFQKLTIEYVNGSFHLVCSTIISVEGKYGELFGEAKLGLTFTASIIAFMLDIEEICENKM